VLQFGLQPGRGAFARVGYGVPPGALCRSKLLRRSMAFRERQPCHRPAPKITARRKEDGPAQPGATAALAGVQYLLTQNCKHIANAHELPRIYRLLDEFGLSGMLICTPTEFLGGNDDVT